MIYAITSSGVENSASVAGINKKLSTELKKEDFKRVGNDLILNLTEDDFDFIKDRKQISRIIMSRLFKKESGQFLLYVMLVMLFIILIK